MRTTTVDDDRLISSLRRIADPIEPAPVFLDRLYETLAVELGFRAEPATRSVPAMRRPRSPSVTTFLRFSSLSAAAVAVVAAVIVGSQMMRTGPAAVQPAASASIVPTQRPLAGNGLIAVGRDDGILLLDPTTGKTVTRLETPLPLVTAITWAPDGKRLAFNVEVQIDVNPSADPSPGGVWVMDVSTGRSKQLLQCRNGPDACGVAWSPDGSRIAVTHGSVLELIDPVDGHANVLQAFDRWASGPTWSPDSARIAVSLQDGELTAVDRDGSGRTTLLPDIGGATWSPDGSTFAYLAGTDVQCPEASDAQECAGDSDLTITLLRLATNTPEELGPGGRCGCYGVGPFLGWSPDGTRLVLVLPPLPSRPSADFGLFVMNADGSDLHLLSDGYAWSPAWQPVP
jgi:Tol biopolymer transport system component